MALYRTGGSSQKVAVGTFTTSTSSKTTVNIGFKPKYLCVRLYSTSNTSPYTDYIYDERYSTTAYHLTGTSTTLTNKPLGESNNYRLYSINDDGFTVNAVASGYTRAAYFAIG